MPPWIVSAIVSGVASTWERQFSAGRSLKHANVANLLKDIDKALRQTNKLLNTHRSILPASQYSIFKAEHRSFRLEFTDKQHSSETTGLTDRTSSVKLLEDVRTFRKTVIVASRQAVKASIPNFPDDEPIQEDPQTLSDAQETPLTEETTPIANIPTSHPGPSEASIPPSEVGPTENSSPASTSPRETSNQAPGAEFVECHGIAIAVAHTLRDPARNLYERMIYVRMDSGQYEIPDPEFHVLEPDQVVVDDRTLAEAFVLVGEFMRNPERFQRSDEETEIETTYLS
ncbi:hypothetical protein FRC07_009298 [Ceratobasidium sp. 392]|nr:hypothetical protein FRC07_009298 [Ceratobasidium sp. 392]